MGGDFMEMDWSSSIVLVAITIAVVNRIKKVTIPLKTYWYTVISMLVGVALYFIGMYAPPVVTGALAVGLIASGIWDIRKGKIPIA